MEPQFDRTVSSLVQLAKTQQQQEEAMNLESQIEALNEKFIIDTKFRELVRVLRILTEKCDQNNITVPELKNLIPQIIGGNVDPKILEQVCGLVQLAKSCQERKMPQPDLDNMVSQIEGANEKYIMEQHLTNLQLFMNYGIKYNEATGKYEEIDTKNIELANFKHMLLGYGGVKKFLTYLSVVIKFNMYMVFDPKPVKFQGTEYITGTNFRVLTGTEYMAQHNIDPNTEVVGYNPGYILPMMIFDSNSDTVLFQFDKNMMFIDDLARK